MRAALKAAIRYAKDRKVFGAPLIDYPLTQVKIAHDGGALCRVPPARLSPSAGSSTAAAAAWRRAS